MRIGLVQLDINAISNTWYLIHKFSLKFETKLSNSPSVANTDQFVLTTTNV